MLRRPEVIGGLLSAPPPQTLELADYSAKITLLEEIKREKEEEAESWHIKVTFS